MVTINYPKTEFMEREDNPKKTNNNLKGKFLSIRNRVLRLGFLDPKLLLTENITEMINMVKNDLRSEYKEIPCDRSIDRAVRLAKQFLREDLNLNIDDFIVRRMESDHKAVLGGLT